MERKIKKYLWINLLRGVRVVFLLLTNLFYTQTLSSSLNKNQVQLGEKVTYRIKVEHLHGKPVITAPKNELLPFHFEEIKDSIVSKPDFYLREIDFVILDEGIFILPSFQIKVGEQIHKTAAYEIQVFNTAQKGEPIRDIMTNKSLELGIADYWELYKWYILGVWVLLSLLFLVRYFLRYGRKKATPIMVTNEAIKALEQLKKKKYLEKGEIRMFYVELMDISRDFITKQYKIPADVLLTDDLIEVLKMNQTMSLQNEQLITKVFLRGDAAKFAKIYPKTEVAEEDYSAIKTFVKKASKDLEFENLRKDV